ncbi:MAG TPA: hemerythrin family protein [Firmicutes bacterium]|nr:hemerythrin family protein [Bacillota bacterium]
MRWSSDLEIGIPLLDEQHKTWFERAEQLFEAGKQRRAKEVIGELLEFLDQYTKKHFAQEEQYMLSIGYPGYEAQKKAHEGFIQRLAELSKNYDDSGGSVTVIINANKIVIDWLIGHISRMDRKIADYVRETETQK